CGQQFEDAAHVAFAVAERLADPGRRRPGGERLAVPVTGQFAEHRACATRQRPVVVEYPPDVLDGRIDDGAAHATRAGSEETDSPSGVCLFHRLQTNVSTSARTNQQRDRAVIWWQGI